jgi:hypothetical protein
MADEFTTQIRTMIPPFRLGVVLNQPNQLFHGDFSQFPRRVRLQIFLVAFNKK